MCLFSRQSWNSLVESHIACLLECNVRFYTSNGLSDTNDFLYLIKKNHLASVLLNSLTVGLTLVYWRYFMKHVYQRKVLPSLDICYKAFDLHYFGTRG